MENSPTYQFYVGSAGWEHPAWTGSFYPEDLPPEWRLAFYRNEYSAVYLPYAQWSQLDEAELSSWRNDVSSGFRFLLERNPQGVCAEDRRKVEQMKPCVVLVDDAEREGGQETDGEVLWLEKGQDLKSLAESLGYLASGSKPVFMLSRDGDLETMQRAKTLLEIMGL